MPSLPSLMNLGIFFSGGIFLVLMAVAFALLEGRYLSESIAGDPNGEAANLERGKGSGRRS